MFKYSLILLVWACKEKYLKEVNVGLCPFWAGCWVKQDYFECYSNCWKFCLRNAPCFTRIYGKIIKNCPINSSSPTTRSFQLNYSLITQTCQCPLTSTDLHSATTLIHDYDHRLPPAQRIESTNGYFPSRSSVSPTTVPHDYILWYMPKHQTRPLVLYWLAITAATGTTRQLAWRRLWIVICHQWFTKLTFPPSSIFVCGVAPVRNFSANNWTYPSCLTDLSSW